ncbi:MAG: PsbP-related protein [Patescibacteria group bacterium]
MERGVRRNKNSNWIWVMVVVVVLALAVIWIITRTETLDENRDLNQASAINNSNQNQANELINFNSNNTNALPNQNTATALQEYSNTEYGFSLSYPSAWAKTTSVTGSGADKIFSLILNDPNHTDNSVSVSVMDDSLEGQVKNSISVSTDTAEVVNGQTAERLTGGSAKDGSLVTLVLFKQDGKLYSLRGSGQDYESIVKSFEMK